MDMTAHRNGERRVALLAAALTVLATVPASALAGCSGGGDAPAVATAASGGPAPPASPATDAVARYVEAQRAWVRCLREQGYPDIPDPDARGRVAIDGETNRRLKTEGLAVLERCRMHNVEVPAELQDRPEPVTPERLARMRAYAKCMRDNGMPDYPDPRPDGEWPDFGARELTPQEHRANELALQICDPVFEGRPPTTPDPDRTGQG
jgi:hypothetical protein